MPHNVVSRQMLLTVVRQFAINAWLYAGLIVAISIAMPIVSIGLASLAEIVKELHLDELRTQVKERSGLPQII